MEDKRPHPLLSSKLVHDGRPCESVVMPRFGRVVRWMCSSICLEMSVAVSPPHFGERGHEYGRRGPTPCLKSGIDESLPSAAIANFVTIFIHVARSSHGKLRELTKQELI